MSIHNLERIFNPASVAIVGASETPGSIGRSLIKNVVDGGYKGKIFPVNPKHKRIYGLETWNSVLDIGQSIDLAVLATPIMNVPSIIRECVLAKIAGAIVLSAGGKEIGEKGRELGSKSRRRRPREISASSPPTASELCPPSRGSTPALPA